MRCLGIKPPNSTGEDGENDRGADYRAIRIDGVLTPDELLDDEEL
jgi:hypothetical protein